MGLTVAEAMSLESMKQDLANSYAAKLNSGTQILLRNSMLISYSKGMTDILNMLKEEGYVLTRKSDPAGEGNDNSAGTS